MNTTSNYCQVMPMTFEEKVKMYMKCSKLELAKMLAARPDFETTPAPATYPVPECPRPEYVPAYPTYPIITCSSINDFLPNG